MNTSWMGRVGSANDTKWVGFELEGLGWAGLIKMDPCPCLGAGLPNVNLGPLISRKLLELES